MYGMDKTIRDSCAAIQCKNNTENCSYNFFKFPREPAKFKLWAFACGRRDLINQRVKDPRKYKLCATHFENHMFADCKKSRLKLDAIPSRATADRLAAFHSSAGKIKVPPHIKEPDFINARDLQTTPTLSSPVGTSETATPITSPEKFSPVFGSPESYSNSPNCLRAMEATSMQKLKPRLPSRNVWRNVSPEEMLNISLSTPEKQKIKTSHQLVEPRMQHKK